MNELLKDAKRASLKSKYERAMRLLDDVVDEWDEDAILVYTLDESFDDLVQKLKYGVRFKASSNIGTSHPDDAPPNPADVPDGPAICKALGKLGVLYPSWEYPGTIEVRIHQGILICGWADGTLGADWYVDAANVDRPTESFVSDVKPRMEEHLSANTIKAWVDLLQARGDDESL